jgi:hypothetical protein
MNANILPSNRAVVAATIDPDAYTAAAYTSDYVSLADFESLMAVIMVGTMASTSTVDAKLVQATDSSGTGSKDISGKAITQLTEAGTDSDKQAIINCRSDELDVAGGFTHVAVTVTVGTAASDMGAVIIGLDGRYQPVADLASVDEVIS